MTLQSRASKKTRPPFFASFYAFAFYAEGKGAKKGMELQTLIKSIQNAWRKDTSFWKNKWTPRNPAMGHCSVSALLLQKHFGGAIIYSKKSRHYANILPDGTWIDLTRNQFHFKKNIQFDIIKTRHELLKDRDIYKRYCIYEKRVEKIIYANNKKGF